MKSFNMDALHIKCSCISLVLKTGKKRVISGSPTVFDDKIVYKLTERNNLSNMHMKMLLLSFIIFFKFHNILVTIHLRIISNFGITNTISNKCTI